jgi:fluoride ion exporter CrcB/FEX
MAVNDVVVREDVVIADTRRRKPNGEAMAATLAAGIGCFALGVFINLTELSTTFREWMLLHDGVGPLSGKTTYATIVYIAAWALLHVMWKDREIAFRPVVLTFGILLAVGFVLDWPPFFEWVAEEFGPE